MDACVSTQPGRASGNAPYWSCVGEFCGREGLGYLSPIFQSQAVRSYSLHCRNVDAKAVLLTVAHGLVHVLQLFADGEL